MRYSEMNSIEPGLRFKTIGGLIVETTGQNLVGGPNRLVAPGSA